MHQTSNLPQGPIKKIKGKCFYLQGNDIDTDRIIPARFLKSISFEKLGEQVFSDDRKEQNGLHPFDLVINQTKSILIVNKNFGCGSSREHAPQALMRWGIRAIIGESFAEIFYGNCLSIGIPCAKISNSNITNLVNHMASLRDMEVELNLQNEQLISKKNSWPLNIEKSSLDMFLSGNWDGTSTLIKSQDLIKSKSKSIPYLNNFKF
ncbi:3-isopropylmalate dehydratase small subunit [Prochlorococcus marinus]|uniref:3-isopropylmalate dehydratase small subunit n=1 Tax=Prochlorococcus marinus TaxID=1219 RepID=UPI0022B4D035|nr:3-isopropylmalate dehydratase small subunit [Prochlorococcus marinus]